MRSISIQNSRSHRCAQALLAEVRTEIENGQKLVALISQSVCEDGPGMMERYPLSGETTV